MNEQKSPPVIIESSGQIRLSGEWTTSYLKQLQKISKDKKTLSVQQVDISRLDTNGARVLLEIIGDRSESWPEGLSKEQLGLLSLVKSKIGPIPNEQTDLALGFLTPTPPDSSASSPTEPRMPIQIVPQQ